MIIEIRKLVKRFGAKPVLRGLDFTVSEGEFVALVGPNGAGKTTFLRVLASLARPSLGSVSIAGFQLPAQAADVRRSLGVVGHLPLSGPTHAMLGQLWRLNRALRLVPSGLHDERP